MLDTIFKRVFPKIDLGALTSIGLHSLPTVQLFLIKKGAHF